MCPTPLSSEQSWLLSTSRTLTWAFCSDDLENSILCPYPLTAFLSPPLDTSAPEPHPHTPAAPTPTPDSHGVPLLSLCHPEATPGPLPAALQGLWDPRLRHTLCLQGPRGADTGHLDHWAPRLCIFCTQLNLPHRRPGSRPSPASATSCCASHGTPGPPHASPAAPSWLGHRHLILVPLPPASGPLFTHALGMFQNHLPSLSGFLPSTTSS